MTSATYPLDQSTRLAISGLLSAGHEESADSLPPIEDGPRFSLPRHMLAGNTPFPPRHYYGANDGDASPDLYGNVQARDSDSEYSEEKNGDFSDFRPFDPSAIRSRREVFATLSDMGYAWNE